MDSTVVWVLLLGAFLVFAWSVVSRETIDDSIDEQVDRLYEDPAEDSAFTEPGYPDGWEAAEWVPEESEPGLSGPDPFTVHPDDVVPLVSGLDLATGRMLAARLRTDDIGAWLRSAPSGVEVYAYGSAFLPRQTLLVLPEDYDAAADLVRSLGHRVIGDPRSH